MVNNSARDPGRKCGVRCDVSPFLLSSVVSVSGVEARHAAGVVGQRRRQGLDGHVTVQARVVRAVDLAHPARANRRRDFVGPQVSAGR